MTLRQEHGTFCDGTAALNKEELSVSLYHEIYEGNFEESARSAHARYGMACPTSLNEMRENFGFGD